MPKIMPKVKQTIIPSWLTYAYFINSLLFFVIYYSMPSSFLFMTRTRPEIIPPWLLSLLLVFYVFFLLDLYFSMLRTGTLRQGLKQYKMKHKIKGKTKGNPKKQASSILLDHEKSSITPEEIRRTKQAKRTYRKSILRLILDVLLILALSFFSSLALPTALTLHYLCIGLVLFGLTFWFRKYSIAPILLGGILTFYLYALLWYGYQQSFDLRILYQIVPQLFLLFGLYLSKKLYKPTEKKESVWMRSIGHKLKRYNLICVIALAFMVLSLLVGKHWLSNWTLLSFLVLPQVGYLLYLMIRIELNGQTFIPKVSQSALWIYILFTSYEMLGLGLKMCLH